MRKLAALLALLAACSPREETPQTDACATLHIECPNEPRATEERVRASCATEGCAAYWSCVAKNVVCDGRGRFDEAASSARCVAVAGCAGDAGDDGASDVAEDVAFDAAEDTLEETSVTEVGGDTSGDTGGDGTVSEDVGAD